uniref:Truncated transposase n=1 Tax=Erysipelothrix tonsillarum TaxID=38402 RepID=A0A6S6I6I7_9FIRM|nr:truncated transposase [Erysipelothrix tonsillarum]
MCKYLNVSRSTIYSYRPKIKEIDHFEDEVINAFYKSHSIYGSRKIRAALQRKGINTSRRRISRIMRKHDLVSVYTKKKYRNHSSVVNESKIGNLVNRDLNDSGKLQVVVSDLI